MPPKPLRKLSPVPADPVRRMIPIELDNDETLNVDAVVVDQGLAVHRGVGDDAGGFVVVHLRSGYRMSRPFSTEQRAINTALQLAKLANWNQYESGNIPAALKDKAVALIRAARTADAAR